MANRTIVSEERTVRSRSLVKRQQMPNQAKVRSTVQRIGTSSQPLTLAGRSMTLSSVEVFNASHSSKAKLWYCCLHRAVELD